MPHQIGPCSHLLLKKKFKRHLTPMEMDTTMKLMHSSMNQRSGPIKMETDVVTTPRGAMRMFGQMIQPNVPIQMMMDMVTMPQVPTPMHFPMNQHSG